MNTHTALATVFGIGRLKPAPGTLASLVALPIAWGIAASGGLGFLLVGTVALFAIGTWACDRYIREHGNEDPSECVIDEVVGQWLACLFAPLGVAAYALAFVLFRVLDIAKPWPISAADRMKGGIGVMFDDVVAALAAGLAVAAAHYWRLV